MLGWPSEKNCPCHWVCLQRIISEVLLNGLKGKEGPGGSHGECPTWMQPVVLDGYDYDLILYPSIMGTCLDMFRQSVVEAEFPN